jgi:hypothetical protein
MATNAETAWGRAAVVDEVALQQRAGEKRFAAHVQLLEGPTGEVLIRFAYSTDGVPRRGPVTLRARDLSRLRASLADHPRLAAALGFPEGGEA